ncbi:unnamed protein product [Cyprideis torosa]|uniref:Uncharacterized protein n=1 Tax=Cyprideis torosa TaxID=163714 RepID=A0A7R8ZK61_9CRUS|nr:unnamed protein product [Cyprideis torosa]CAG0883792.1 unnamed protein product [Cyprideis torosa]
MLTIPRQNFASFEMSGKGPWMCLLLLVAAMSSSGVAYKARSEGEMAQDDRGAVVEVLDGDSPWGRPSGKRPKIIRAPITKGLHGPPFMMAHPESEQSEKDVQIIIGHPSRAKQSIKKSLPSALSLEDAFSDYYSFFQNEPLLDADPVKEDLKEEEEKPLVSKDTNKNDQKDKKIDEEFADWDLQRGWTPVRLYFFILSLVLLLCLLSISSMWCTGMYYVYNDPRFMRSRVRNVRIVASEARRPPSDYRPPPEYY